MNLCHLARLAAFVVLQLVGQAHCISQTTSYHIGNSLTYDSQPLALEAFATQIGLAHTVGFHIRESSALNEILADPSDTTVEPHPQFGTYQQALPGHEWDFVTIQPHQSKDNPETPEFDPSTLATDVSAILHFIDLTRSNPANSDTKFYIYSAWPSIANYLNGHWYGQTHNFDGALTVHTRRYYEHLINRVRDATDADVFMVPVGEVLFELDKRITAGDTEPLVDSFTDLYRDSLHLALDIGRYMASITTFTTLLQEDPFQLSRPDGFFRKDEAFSPEYLEALNEVVRRVVATHRYSGATLALPTTADFDGNGVVEAGDLSRLVESFDVVLKADANSDRRIDGEDFLEWQRTFGPSPDVGVGGAGDLDRDGFIDGHDLEIVLGSLGISGVGDINNNGVTDGADFLAWQRNFTPYDLADFDQDRDVDGADLVTWSGDFGLHLDGDSNRDGIVNGVDFLAWQREFGYISLQTQQLAPSVGAVPEPSSLMLMNFLLLGFAKRIRSCSTVA